ncbi:gas vesicle protein [Streptomyces sp. NPDC002734]|uniref:gas vesicle protein GvpO n=1 Tax=Streptomyces sp. NPDC002734 TaxID=3154426 RepID=UPI003323C39E
MTNKQETEDTEKAEDTESAEKTEKTEKKEPEQRRPRPTEVLREARGQLEELTGMAAESVSSFERTEDGWSLQVEVLELERVPDTMSLLGTYQVDLDPDGMLTGYKRIRRYERGRSDGNRR